MKKQLVLVTGLAVLAAPAFASKARLQALGEDLNGSLYINDNRNIFLNASAVNDHKDLVTYEWGSSPAVTDGAASPRAEGGFFKSAGNMVYGVQFGGQADSSHLFRAASGVATTDGINAAAENNGIEAFVGGDAGVKWGASVYHSNTKGGTGIEQESMRVKLGASQNNWSTFANINIANEATASGAQEKFKGELGYQVGGNYMWNDYTFFGEYRSLKGEAGKTTKRDLETTRYEVGVGRQTKVNDKATIFTKVSYRSIEGEGLGLADLLAGGNGTDTSFSKFEGKFVPAIIGMEYSAASWLVLRGSVVQNIFINDRKEGSAAKTSNNATTAVNAGASLLFGDMSIDTALSSGTDNNYGRVSATYRF